MAQNIIIPFRPYFKMPMQNGIKVCTSRTRRMGEPGDRFSAFARWFELTAVTLVTVGYVTLLWKEEGCLSEVHFIDIWKSIHPGVGYDPDQSVFLHRFTQVLKGYGGMHI